MLHLCSWHRALPADLDFLIRDFKMGAPFRDADAIVSYDASSYLEHMEFLDQLLPTQPGSTPDLVDPEDPADAAPLDPLDPADLPGPSSRKLRWRRGSSHHAQHQQRHSRRLAQAAQPYASVMPNDPFVANGSQWHIHRVKAPNAWALSTGELGMQAGMQAGMQGILVLPPEPDVWQANSA